MLSSNADDTTLLATPVVVYTIYSLLKTSLSTVLAVLRKENTITSCLMLNSCCIKIVFINRCLFKFRWYSVCRLANRPGMARIVPELTHGVLCPGRGSFCPGNVKIDHRAWIYGCSLMSVLYFVSCLSVTHDLTLNLFLWKCTKTVATRAAPFGWDMHQIVCRLGVRPRPHWGGAQWEKRREGRGKRKEGKGGEWSERSPGMPKSRVGKPICVFCTIFFTVLCVL